MTIRITIGAVLSVGMVVAISYFFGASFYMALIGVVGFGVFGEIVHMPENMPGEYDNPEGKGLHPAKAILIGVFLVMVLVGVGYIFPVLYTYGFIGS